MDKEKRIDELLGGIRSLRKSNRESLFPIAFNDGINHQPVDPMHFVLGDWTATPWEGVTCYGITLTEKLVKVMCQVEKPIRMDKQEHGPWEERLVMDEGELFEHSTGSLYKPGDDGVYLQPSGVIHEPEFKTPSVCVITWRRS